MARGSASSSCRRRQIRHRVYKLCDNSSIEQNTPAGPVRHRTGAENGRQTVDLPSQPRAIHLSNIACTMASQRHGEPASDTSRASNGGLDASQTSSERSTFERDVPELSRDARALFASYGFPDDDQLKQHLRAVVSLQSEACPVQPWLLLQRAHRVPARQSVVDLPIQLHRSLDVPPPAHVAASPVWRGAEQDPRRREPAGHWMLLGPGPEEVGERFEHGI
jgi:hypothetical protein